MSRRSSLLGLLLVCCAGCAVDIRHSSCGCHAINDCRPQPPAPIEQRIEVEEVRHERAPRRLFIEEPAPPQSDAQTPVRFASPRFHPVPTRPVFHRNKPVAPVHMAPPPAEVLPPAPPEPLLEVHESRGNKISFKADLNDRIERVRWDAPPANPLRDH